MLSLPILYAAAILAAPPSLPAADTMAIRTPMLHVGDGTTVENAVIVVTDGLVVSVGTSAPDGVTVTDVDGQVAPGFIAMRDATGTSGENNESTRKFTPNADVARAFDPTHPAWHRLVAEGVTTVVLTPSSSRIAGGLDAIVSPASGKVVKRGAAMHLGMSSSALSSFEEPTSYAGLYAHLEKHFAGAKEGSPFADAKAGKLPVMMEAVTRPEVLRAASFAKAHGLKGAIVGAPQADEVIDHLKDAGVGVVLTPMMAGASRDIVDSAVALRRAGIPFAFAADASRTGPASFRMTAAACMRGGLDAHGALAAMTKSAADLLGVSATHGTVAKGKVADLVVWTGTPTDLTSRVSMVFSGGHLVHPHGAHGGAAKR